MSGLLRDLRLAVRTLMKNRGFTLAAASALALGIGANAAIFSIVNAVLFRPLPCPSPERVVAVWETNRNVNPNQFADPKAVAAMKKWMVVSRNFSRWERQPVPFDVLAGFIARDVTVTGGGEPERVRALAATPGIFALTGVRPALGRVFRPDENQPGSDEVVLLGHGLWQRRYGGRRDVLGMNVTIDGLPHTIIGVLPADFNVVLMPRELDLVLPMEHIMQGQGARRFAIFEAAGRLKPGISIARAQKEMDAVAARLEAETPRTNRGRGVMLVPIREEIAGDVRPALLVLLGAVGCVLLIACANVANLLLARTAAQRHELGIRSVLGSGSWALMRQVLAESVVLSVAGGIAGVLLARWGVSAMVALMPQGLIPRVEDITLDWRVLAFAFLVSVATGVLLGVVPAVQAARWCARGDLSESLKEGGRLGSAGGSRRLRSALVISEVAIALVLLTGAGLLIRTFLSLRAVDPGFRPENLLTMQLSLAETKYKDGRQRAAFADQVLERVQSLPAVESAACANSLPMWNLWTVSWGISIEGRPEVDASVNHRSVSPDYFRTMGMHLIKGRGFTAGDRLGGTVIVNEAMVRRFWPDAPKGSTEPLGRRIRFGGGWLEIVGVVSDVKFDSLDRDTTAEAYVPHTENPVPALALVVRTGSDPMRLLPAIRGTIRSVDPDQPIDHVQTMEQIVYATVAKPRFHMLLVGVFAALALALAAVGIYGVISYSVTRRTHEIGVKMALGANAGRVLLAVVGEACVLALAGIAAGLAGAFTATRLLAQFLFGVKPTDAATFVAVSLLLLAVAAAASYIPARRASRIDPITALKYE